MKITRAASIFTTASLGQNWAAENFDRIRRGEANEIGNDLGRVNEVAEKFFIALACGIELARKGEANDIIHKSSDYPHDNQDMTRKLSLLREGALLVITLNKNGQLRGWVGGPRILFSDDGGHVDGYGANGIFDIEGDYVQLKGLAERYLTNKMRRFEDDKYVVWV